MRILHSSSLLNVWNQVLELIKVEGMRSTDENQTIFEFMDLFLEIINPSTDPSLMAVNPEMARWMHVNFTEKTPIPELGCAKSYFTRLHDYNGKDQLATVVMKLKNKPETKSATITMLMPNEDSSYIPCVSLLDFKIRDNKLLLTITCRSLDFGKKALYNLVELTAIGKQVQDACNVPGLELHVHVISAHLYEKDMKSIGM